MPDVAVELLLSEEGEVEFGAVVLRDFLWARGSTSVVWVCLLLEAPGDDFVVEFNEEEEFGMRKPSEEGIKPNSDLTGDL